MILGLTGCHAALNDSSVPSFRETLLVSSERVKHLDSTVEDTSGPDSSVGIATGYGLNDPGIESRCGRYFPHLSRPDLRPTQPPVQWVPGLSQGIKSGRGVTLTPHPLLVPLVMKE
jgi:hypothetical protein